MLTSKPKIRKQVLAMRESIATVVTLLSTRKIEVVLSGSSAYVMSDKYGEPVRVNLPQIADNASDDTLHAMRGFLDHEVAHILFTDFKWRASYVPSQLEHLWNICEDIYIERKMADSLRGCGFNLGRTRNHVIKDVIEDAYLKAIEDPTSTPKKIFLETLCMPVMRALCGQPQFIDWMNDGNKWTCIEPVLSEIKKRKVAEFIDGIDHTSQSLTAAKMLADIILEPEEETPPSDDGEDGEKSDDGDPSGDRGDDKSDPSGDSEDDDVSVNNEPSKPSDDGEESDSQDGDKDSDQDGDQDAADCDLPSDSDGNGDDSDDSNGDDGNDSARPDNESEQESSDQKQEQDYSDLENYAPPLSLEDCLEKIINGDKDDTEQYACVSNDLDWMGCVSDYPQAAASIMAKTGHSDATTDYFKEVATIQYNRGHRHFAQRIEPLLIKGSAMAKEIQRLILGKEKIQWQGNRRSGVVHGGSLFKLKVGDNRVFRNRIETKAKKACVLIVNDLSGSMRSECVKGTPITRIDQALAASYTIADAMDKANIPCMVSGFTTISEDDRCTLVARASKRGEVTDDIKAALRKAYDDATRIEPLVHPIIKSWDAPCTSPKVIKNFGFCAGFEPLLRNNVDGESLLSMLSLFSQRDEEIKIMLVLSDGEPAAIGRLFHPHLKSVTEYIEKQTDITLIGVGIASDTDRFYRVACRVDDIGELPKIVCSEIKKALLL